MSSIGAVAIGKRRMSKRFGFPNIDGIDFRGSPVELKRKLNEVKQREADLLWRQEVLFFHGIHGSANKRGRIKKGLMAYWEPVAATRAGVIRATIHHSSGVEREKLEAELKEVSRIADLEEVNRVRLKAKSDKIRAELEKVQGRKKDLEHVLNYKSQLSK